MEDRHAVTTSGGARIQIEGMKPLLDELAEIGRNKDLNRELRSNARLIATNTLLPAVVEAVSQGAAPQSRVMAQTARVVSDRVPVVALGRVNPKFSTRWTRKGETGPERRRRRGSMARGVVVGPLGGHRDTAAQENYYKVPRDPSGGPLGRAMREGGALLEEGRKAYLAAYVHVLKRHGFDSKMRAG